MSDVPNEVRTRRIRPSKPRSGIPMWWRVGRWVMIPVLLFVAIVGGFAVGPKVADKVSKPAASALPSATVVGRPSGAPQPSAKPNTLPVVTDKDAVVPGAMVQLSGTIVGTLLSLNPLDGTSQAGAWPEVVTVAAGAEGSKCNLEVIQGTPRVYPCAVNGKTMLYVYEQRLNVLIKNGDTTPVAAEVIYAFGNLVDKRAANTSSAERDACFAGIATTAFKKSGFLDDAAYKAVATYLNAKGGDKAKGFQRGLTAKTC